MLQNNLVPPSAGVGLVGQILASPPAIVASIALIINTLLFIANLLVSFRTHRREARFKIELSFYDMTVLRSLSELFKFVAAVKAKYCELVNKYTITEDEGTCRKSSEACIATFDDLHESNENNVLPYFDGFSSDLGKNLRSLFETYYDNVTEIISKYSQPKLNSLALSRLSNNFGKETGIVIKEMYDLSKKYCPK